MPNVFFYNSYKPGSSTPTRECSAYKRLPSVISSYKSISLFIYTPTIIFANPELRKKDEFFYILSDKNVFYTCSYCNSTQFSKRQCVWSSGAPMAIFANFKGTFPEVGFDFCRHSWKDLDKFFLDFFRCSPLLITTFDFAERFA